MKIRIANCVFGTFLSNLFYFGKWFVTGGCIGYVNGKQIQELKEIVFRFSFLVIVYYPKNKYVFYE